MRTKSFSIMRKGGQVALPKTIRDELGLKAGDVFDSSTTNGSVVLTPQKALDEELAKGLEDIKKGRVIGPFKTAKDAMRTLRARAR